MIRAALYVRLSVSDDHSTSLERQEADLRALCHREGWEVAELFVDDGLSGASDRPKAQRALTMLRRGEVDVLATWKLDRWSRMGLPAVAELLDAIKVAGERALFVALQDGLRSDQPAFEIIASVLASVAKMERDNTSMRIKSHVRSAIRGGRWAGGPVWIGYDAAPHPSGKGRTLVPRADMAEVLESAATRLLEGESVYAVVRWLNGTAVRPPRSSSWSPRTLVRVLTGTAIVGRQTLDGDVIRDADGLPRASFEPVINVNLWHAVRTHLLAAQAERPKLGHRSPSNRSRVLSGLIRCDQCNAPLYVRQRQDGAPTYNCSTRSNGGECNGVAITAPAVEEFVVEQYLRRFGSFEVVEPIEVEAPATDLVEAERAFAELGARLDDPTLDDEVADEFEAQRRALRRRIHTLREAAARRTPEIEYRDTGETTRDRWAALSDVGARRDFLATAIEAVSIGKGVQGRRGFDLSRVDIYGKGSSAPWRLD